MPASFAANPTRDHLQDFRQETETDCFRIEICLKEAKTDNKIECFVLNCSHSTSSGGGNDRIVVLPGEHL